MKKTPLCLLIAVALTIGSAPSALAQSADSYGRAIEADATNPVIYYDAACSAYLTDRVRVNEGKEQLYGTQFHTVDGKLVPRPIEEEEHLEARRAEPGMISMKEYTARMTGGD